MDGTSMATPHVGAVAAMIIQGPGPELGARVGAGPADPGDLGQLRSWPRCRAELPCRALAGAQKIGFAASA
jgi:hypothetical protein